MNEYSDFRATMAHLDILSEPKLLLAVICSLASKLVGNDTIAKATEEVLRVYNSAEEIKSQHNREDVIMNTPEPISADFHTAVIDDKNLSTVDKCVYIALCSQADKNTHECQPKVIDIANKASCSERAVRDSLATLEKRGIIKRKFRYINHRQIPSLYTVFGAESLIPTENQTHIAEAENNPVIKEVSYSTEQEDTYSTGGNEGGNQCSVERNTVPDGRNSLQGEKTLESLKIPYRGAYLPALAEKESKGTNARIPEDPEEKTKDSLTGGALLPISECKDQNPENPQGDIASASEAKTEETLFIRAEYDETAQTDTAQTAVCENPVIRPDAPLVATVSRTATGEAVIPEIPEWLMKQYEAAKKRYAELYDQPKPTEAPKKAEQPPMEPEEPKMPEPGTTEYYQRRLENTRNAFPELCQPVKQIVSVASQMADVLADIKKPKVDKSGETAQAECETPVVKAEEKCDTPAPSDKPINAPEPVEEVKPAERSTADNVPAISDTPISPVKTPETATKPVAPKNTAKGKRAVSRHPKELYSPSDAPEIMQATAEYFLYKTGRVALRWEEIAVLRKFSATQYPAVVQKEIVRACERFKKRKESLKCLTLMYVAVALEKRPTYGKKKELSEEKKKYFAQYEPEKKEYTAEELDAIQARIDEMQAKFNAEEEERRRRLQ